MVHLVGNRFALQPVGFGNDRERWKRGHDGIAVGRGARDIGMPDAAACSASVLHYDVLSQFLRKVGGERARREVGYSARRKWHHNRYGARGPWLLGEEAARWEGGCRGSREHQPQEFPPIVHGASPCHQILHLQTTLPQIARAASTASCSFARWSASLSGLPAAGLAKPHCGLIARRSSSMDFAAPSPRRSSVSMFSNAGVFLLVSPRPTAFSLRAHRRGAKSPARGVSYSRRKWLTLVRAKKRSAMDS